MNKIKSEHQCIFCNSDLNKLSASINRCEKCDANHYLVTNEAVGTQIISFDTKKYSVQIYKTETGGITRANYLDDRQALFWVKEELALKNTTLEKIDSRLDKLLAII